MTKIEKRTCNLCGIMMTGGREGFIKHGEEKHSEFYLSGEIHHIRFVEKKYYCPLDQKWYSSRKHMARTIKEYGLSNEQYYLKYGQEYMPEEWAKNTSDPEVKDAHNHNRCLHCNKEVKFNEGKWLYPAFCGFSCSTKWYAVNTNRIEQAMNTLKERKSEDSTLHLRPNQLKYWINKGFSEEESKEKVKQRQQTNTKERFIERYGPEIGLEKWFQRQEKWFNTLKERGMFSGVSEVSSSFFAEVDKSFGNLRYGNNELTIRLDKGWCKTDCINPDNNRIVEFYGDYWHGNPKVYKGTDLIKQKILVEEKWEADKIRVEKLEQKGYKVMIIWESEYINNRAATIAKCIEFLKEE